MSALIAVNEHKKVNVIPREQAACFALLYDSALLAYHVVNDRGELVDVNPAWEALFGYSRQEALGLAFDQFVAPVGDGDAARVDAALHATGAAKRPNTLSARWPRPCATRRKRCLARWISRW